MNQPDLEPNSADEDRELAALGQDFPDASDGELLEARENLHRYFDLAARTYRRLAAEGYFDKSKSVSYDSETKVDSNP